MKILLTQCPCGFGSEMPSLGLAYLSAFIKEHGHNVAITDLSIELYRRVDAANKKFWDSNNGFQWYLTDAFYKLPFLAENLYEDFCHQILANDADLLGFSIQNTSALFTLELIKRIKVKAPARKIILGGPNCYNISGDDSDFKLNYGLERFADMIVVGEGEQTLLETLERLQSGESLAGCKGIALPVSGKWVFNGSRDLRLDLNELPFPDFDAFNLNLYTAKNMLPLQTSRGCIMRCVFCTDTNFWRPYRFLNAENAFRTICRMKERYSIKSLSINDSLINGNGRNFMNLCDLMIKNKTGLTWGGNCLVQRGLDRSFFGKLKAAGCNHVILGIESGSNKILKLMRKSFTIEDAKNFIMACYREGIEVVANWIVGFPGETEEDFMATADFIRENKKFIKRNTFSMLTVNQFSYLDQHRDEFGVVLDGPHLGLWYTADKKNTIALRSARLKKLEDAENEECRTYRITRQTSG